MGHDPFIWDAQANQRKKKQFSQHNPQIMSQVVLYLFGSKKIEIERNQYDFKETNMDQKNPI